MFASWINLAFELRVPLHKGHHDFEFSKYNKKAVKKLNQKNQEFQRKQQGKKCDQMLFHELLNGLSSCIHEDIIDYELPISKDYKDYHTNAPNSDIAIVGDNEPAHQGCCQFDENEEIHTQDEKREAIDKWLEAGSETGLCKKNRDHGFNNSGIREFVTPDGRERKTFTVGS